MPIQKHPKHPTKPQLSVPSPPSPPPGRQRASGRSRKNKTHTQNVPTHKHGACPGPPLAPTVILTRCLGPRSPGTTLTTEFRIFLHAPRPPNPPIHSLATEPLGMFCRNTAPQGSVGGPLAPEGPWGPHQHRPVLYPPGRKRHVAPVHSDG